MRYFFPVSDGSNTINDDEGIESWVFESAPSVAGLGLGINLQPIAVRELAQLGLAKGLATVAAPIEELAFYNRHGQRIWSEP
ncbi:MAG: 5-methylphenazine-carboxylate 1-monooxygenase [Acidobacteriaceae bacterium]|nr:5-methylphenazine-carboxylate 1-monooxygenase [Acidobacteriaceae bacterium]